MCIRDSTETAVELRIPLTPSDLAILMRGLADIAGRIKSDGKASATGPLDGLDEIIIDQNVATLRFPAAQDGTIHWKLRGSRHAEAKALVAAFGENLPK